MKLYIIVTRFMKAANRPVWVPVHNPIRRDRVTE